MTVFFILVIYCLIGWFGAFILLTALVNFVGSIYKDLKLDNPINVDNVWKQAIVNIYDWVDIDVEDKVSETYINFKLFSVLAIYASLGTLTIPISFSLIILMFIVKLIYMILYRK